MSDNGQQVPLIERPPRPDADEVDTRGKSEAANDRIAALEHKVETMRDELNIARASIAGLEAELAAERERREAAEAVIHTCQWAMRQPLDGWKGECERKALDEARAHFARHEKD